ncbi:LLM class flavin-dependent oxidoreductase [Sinorhizobium medicae]|nr:LLM class flavin-dependent oxidoreductase [Sinorhizobium medicae]
MNNIEFIGQIAVRDYSEFLGNAAAELCAEEIAETARSHERSSFDSVLVAVRSTWPDPIILASYAAHATKSLRFMVAHRPGLMAPTLAARQFATLFKLFGNRFSVHIVIGADDADMQRDGDFTPKEERYRRAEEYVSALRAFWCSRPPISMDSTYYKTVATTSGTALPSNPPIEVSTGGSSQGRSTSRRDQWTCLRYGVSLKMKFDRSSRLHDSEPAREISSSARPSGSFWGIRRRALGVGSRRSRKRPEQSRRLLVLQYHCRR